MCHRDSPAPGVPDDVAEHYERTGGPDPVPYLTVDSAAAGAATIVLITDIYGINPFYRHLAATLVGHGYRVIIPDVFHRVGPATDASRDAALSRRRLLDDRLAVADIERVLGHVTAENSEYGVLGFCLGGSFALLTAAARPHQVTVTYYAFPKGAPGAKVPVTEPLQVAGAIAGPVLAHWGRDDYIDAGEIGQLTEVLARAPGAAEVRWYDRAGHAFLAGLTDPGHEAAEAAVDSWDHTVRFLREHLAPTRPVSTAGRINNAAPLALPAKRQLVPAIFRPRTVHCPGERGGVPVDRGITTSPSILDRSSIE